MSLNSTKIRSIFNQVKIFDDELTEFEIFQQFINEKEDEEGFHVLDLGDLLRKHQLWIQKMPRVKPYYAIKCNPDLTVIKALAALGANFDCATKREIIDVLSCEVPGNRIIYANPIKFPSHINYAKKVGVKLMTVDSEDEIKIIKKLYPEAEILIRIRCDAKIAITNLGEKFGCDPKTEAIQLTKLVLILGLKLCGYSFHVGSPCGEVSAICRGITLCKNLIDIAKSMNCKDVNVIDIGGGIPGESDSILDEFAGAINDALVDIDPSINIIAEPGRYYVTSVIKSATLVFGKKIILKDDKKTFMYYISDGVFGSFIEELLHFRARRPIAIKNPMPKNAEKFISTIWGPTCDSNDLILKDVLLPEFYIGDWLMWTNMGSYAICCSTEFNGFNKPKVYPIIRKKDWNELLKEISKNRHSKNFNL